MALCFRNGLTLLGHRGLLVCVSSLPTCDSVLLVVQKVHRRPSNRLIGLTTNYRQSNIVSTRLTDRLENSMASTVVV